MTPTERLISFLGNPDSYPHRPDRVELVQTHISVVALSGDLVFKVKKPLNLGFLDFSTVEKRYLYCQSEVQLNRRLCEHVYLGVSPIYLQNGSLSFHGSDQDVVDYAVRMRRIPEDTFLHRMLEAGKLTRSVMDRVRRRLVDFYLLNPTTPEIAQWGTVGRLRISTEENFKQVASASGLLVSQSAIDALRFFTDRFYDTNAALFSQRRAGGYIRDCHGDLHVEHISVGTDVCIYDCIEFSERLRYIDVANDVAFLYMDLMHRGCRDLADSFVTDIAADLDDPDLVHLVRFYAVYRAIVRAKVTAMRSSEPEVPAADRESAAVESMSFFSIALDLAVTNLRPTIVVVFGGVATGKSLVARELGKALGWEVLSSDVERKRLEGVPEFHRGSAEERSRLYSANVTDRVYERLIARAVERGANGSSTILDATFSTRAVRDELRNRAASQMEVRMIEMTAPPNVVVGRLRERREGKHASDARLEDLDQLTTRYEPPDALEDRWHFQIQNDGYDGIDRIVLRVLKHLIRLS